MIPLFSCCCPENFSGGQSLTFFEVLLLFYFLSPGLFAQLQGVEPNFIFDICYAAQGGM